jgi:CO dehydrogenase/acetyl-CoA synthase beta subunit
MEKKEKKKKIVEEEEEEKKESTYQEEKILISSQSGIKLSNLFNNEKYSDFQIVTKEKTIYCHKNILSISSPYFEELFEKGKK